MLLFPAAAVQIKSLRGRISGMRKCLHFSVKLALTQGWQRLFNNPVALMSLTASTAPSNLESELTWLERETRPTRRVKDAVWASLNQSAFSLVLHRYDETLTTIIIRKRAMTQQQRAWGREIKTLSLVYRYMVCYIRANVIFFIKKKSIDIS